MAKIRFGVSAVLPLALVTVAMADDHGTFKIGASFAKDNTFKDVVKKESWAFGWEQNVKFLNKGSITESFGFEFQRGQSNSARFDGWSVGYTVRQPVSGKLYVGAGVGLAMDTLWSQKTVITTSGGVSGGLSGGTSGQTQARNLGQIGTETTVFSRGAVKGFTGVIMIGAHLNKDLNLEVQYRKNPKIDDVTTDSIGAFLSFKF